MFAVIDVETTGGKPGQDRITEIAVFLSDGKKMVDSFSSLVNPERKITPYVCKLTGITDEMVADAPIFSEIADEIDRITKDAVFVAHNINFDYTIVKREFKRLGRAFRRNSICTVKLSQKTIKNQPSYSLGRLCENLGIEIENRHRAFGDAEATAILLHKIIDENSYDFVISETNNFAHNITFTETITQELIESLPEEPGIFRFLNKKGKVLFVKAAKNIFKEVIKFLSEDIKTEHYQDLKKDTVQIDTEVVNSFVVSQLKEIQEIRDEKPLYNKRSIAAKYPIGIVLNQKEDNKAFHIFPLKNQDALWCFHNDRSARRFLKKLVQENQLQITPSQNNVKEYRKKVNNILQDKLYPHRNFFLLREVPFSDEAYAIWIENYTYKGFGKIDLSLQSATLENLKEAVESKDNNPNSQKIIQRYLKKKKNLKLMVY